MAMIFRRSLAAINVVLLLGMAVAQQPAQSSPQSSGQSATQHDQQPMASAMISADRRTQGPAKPPKPIANDVLIRGGTILTVTHGIIQNGSIHIKNGKIVAVGTNLSA